MYSFHKIRAAGAALTVGFLLAVVFATTAQAGGGMPEGLTAQQMRSRAVAMDRYYHLGRFSPAAVALRADRRRAEAIDSYYGLGRNVVVAVSSPFQWSDAGIGAGAMLGAILVAGGLAIALRRRTGKPSVPTTT